MRWYETVWFTTLETRSEILSCERNGEKPETLTSTKTSHTGHVPSISSNTS